jgi:hypothetical protein
MSRGWSTDIRKLERMAQPAPCDGCVHNTRCGFELKACRAFQGYVNTGTRSPNLARIPNRQIFNQVFYEDDIEDQKTLAELRKQLRKEARREAV